MQRLAGYGAALRRLRERAGLNQGQLARRARVGVRTVQRCEVEQGFPALDTVDALLAAMGTDLGELAREIAAVQGGDLVAEGPPSSYPDASSSSPSPDPDPLDALLESAVASLTGLVEAVKKRDPKI